MIVVSIALVWQKYRRPRRVDNGEFSSSIRAIASRSNLVTEERAVDLKVEMETLETKKFQEDGEALRTRAPAGRKVVICTDMAIEVGKEAAGV